MNAWLNMISTERPDINDAFTPWTLPLAPVSPDLAPVWFRPPASWETPAETPASRAGFRTARPAVTQKITYVFHHEQIRSYIKWTSVYSFGPFVTKTNGFRRYTLYTVVISITYGIKIRIFFLLFTSDFYIVIQYKYLNILKQKKLFHSNATISSELKKILFTL